MKWGHTKVAVVDTGGQLSRDSSLKDVWVSSGWPGREADSNVVPNEGELNHLYLVGRAVLVQVVGKEMADTWFSWKGSGQGIGIV